MKRKRFIKLCMAEGKSRNRARRDADFVAWCNENAAEQNKRLKAWGSVLRSSGMQYVQMALCFCRCSEKTEKRIQERYMRIYA